MTSAEKEFIEVLTRTRGMDFLRIGMMVEVDGHIGTISGYHGANITVKFANQLKWGKGSHNCHPTWRTKYYDPLGFVIKDYTKLPE